MTRTVTGTVLEFVPELSGKEAHLRSIRPSGVWQSTWLLTSIMLVSTIPLSGCGDLDSSTTPIGMAFLLASISSTFSELESGSVVVVAPPWSLLLNWAISNVVVRRVGRVFAEGPLVIILPKVVIVLGLVVGGRVVGLVVVVGGATVVVVLGFAGVMSSGRM